jgi:hypothetical protein
MNSSLAGADPVPGLQVPDIVERLKRGDCSPNGHLFLKAAELAVAPERAHLRLFVSSAAVVRAR